MNKYAIDFGSITGEERRHRHIEIQNFLFRLGYNFLSGKVVKGTEKRYLYIRRHPRITAGNMKKSASLNYIVIKQENFYEEFIRMSNPGLQELAEVCCEIIKKSTKKASLQQIKEEEGALLG